jgi:hypothetical protein
MQQRMADESVCLKLPGLVVDVNEVWLETALLCGERSGHEREIRDGSERPWSRCTARGREDGADQCGRA